MVPGPGRTSPWICPFRGLACGTAANLSLAFEALDFGPVFVHHADELQIQRAAAKPIGQYLDVLLGRDPDPKLDQVQQAKVESGLFAQVDHAHAFFFAGEAEEAADGLGSVPLSDGGRDLW